MINQTEVSKIEGVKDAEAATQIANRVLEMIVEDGAADHFVNASEETQAAMIQAYTAEHIRRMQRMTDIAMLNKKQFASDFLQFMRVA